MERQPMSGGQQGSGQQRGTLYEPAPATEAMQNYNHNLIQCLNEKLDSVWRYNKYMQDSPHDPCRQLYQQMMKDDLAHVKMLREEISKHCQQDMFS